MIERSSLRRVLPGFVLGITLLSLASIGCRDPKKDDAPSSAVSTTVAAAAPTAAPSASAAIAQAAPPLPEPVVEDIVDAGSDGGRRKLRRLVAGSPDAGVIVAEADPPPPPPTTEAASEPQRGKRPSTQMGDDLPYGGSTGSAAPLLKKAPLVADDPWAKPVAPAR